VGPLQEGLLLIEDAKDELRMSWEELEGVMNKRGKMCFVRLGLGVGLLPWKAT
jgi:hypothetical protein